MPADPTTRRLVSSCERCASSSRRRRWRTSWPTTPSGDEGAEPDLEEARLAIDGVAALVEGLEGRLGRHQEPLREALAQLRLAFVEISRRAESGDGETGDESG
jgi:hypothetical protein